MESFSSFENPNLITAPREKPVMKRIKVEEDVQFISPPPPKKTRKNPKLKEIKDEDDDNKRNWLDSEVETLIALKGEMQPEFVKNAKKQGKYSMSFRFPRKKKVTTIAFRVWVVFGPQFHPYPPHNLA